MRSRLLARSRGLASLLPAEQQPCHVAVLEQFASFNGPSCSPRCGTSENLHTRPGWNLSQARSIQGFARIAETEEGMTKFSGYYSGGFYLNNVQVPGSVLVTHDLYTLWRPRRMSEVTPESLIALELIKPAPEVLVLGTGASPQPLPPAVRDYLQRIGVRVELLDSRNATGYFNVLNDEGRAVVGALLVWDPDARMPENLPEAQEPLWDREPLMQRSGKI